MSKVLNRRAGTARQTPRTRPRRSLMAVRVVDELLITLGALLLLVNLDFPWLADITYLTDATVGFGTPVFARVG
jgi:hypothetical protein